ncbi:MAG: hypothetical protein U0R19_02405 [Bryobacteraceae bacterium]
MWTITITNGCTVIGYVTPADFLAGRQAFFMPGRDQKLEVARQKREQERRKGRNENLAAIGSQPAGQVPIPFLSGETEAGSRDATMLRDTLTGSSKRVTVTGGAKSAPP